MRIQSCRREAIRSNGDDLLLSPKQKLVTPKRANWRRDFRIGVAAANLTDSEMWESKEERKGGMGRTKKVEVVVVFDFDRTLIEGDSDSWVVTQMGLTPLFNTLRSTLPWNQLMDRMMLELHEQGKTAEDIAECLKGTPIHPQTISAIKSACAFGCNLRIISDANQFFIEKILEHHGLLSCFSQINTNPSFVDDQGRLRIFPYHDLSSPHGCSLCPSNMCKGLIIGQIRDSLPQSGHTRFIYLGDGNGDFCPSLKLGEGDFVMPRKNYPLWNRIHGNQSLVKAEIQGWTDGEELEKILLCLINRISPEKCI